MVTKNITHLINIIYRFPLASGLLWGIAWSAFVQHAWYVGIPITGITLFFWWLLRHHKQIHSIAWLTYSGYILYTIHWFWGMYPLEHTGDFSSPSAYLLVVFGWTIVSFSIGATAVFSTIALRHFSTSSRLILVIPTLFVLLEIIGSLCFYLLTFAEQSLLGPHYTFGYLGYNLTNIEFLVTHLAPLGGIYLLSWVYVFMSLSCTYCLYQKKDLRIIIVTISFLTILCTAHSYMLSLEKNPRTQTVVALRNDSPPTFSFASDALRRSMVYFDNTLTHLAETHTPLDLVVFPEDSRVISYYKDIQKDPPVLFGLIDSSRKNDDFVVGQVDTYHPLPEYGHGFTKLLLVSEGEYLSFTYQILLTLTGNYDAVRRFTTYREYTRGEVIVPSVVHTTPYGVTMCSEIYSPFIQARMSNQSPLLVNLASHSILRGHSLLTQQSEQIAQVRAAENNRYLVRSNNYAPAIIINNRGSVVSRSDRDVLYAHTEVKLIQANTFFSYFPLLFPLLCIIALCISLFRKKIQLLR